MTAKTTNIEVKKPLKLSDLMQRQSDEKEKK